MLSIWLNSNIPRLIQMKVTKIIRNLLVAAEWVFLDWSQEFASFKAFVLFIHNDDVPEDESQLGEPTRNLHLISWPVFWPPLNLNCIV